MHQVTYESLGGDRHRHGAVTHSHPHRGEHAHNDAPHAHGHTHGLVDDSIKRSREGLRAVFVSFGVLGLTALVQTIVFVASGSVALLADLIHNFGDAADRRAAGDRVHRCAPSAQSAAAGLFVVAAIFISACVAGVEAIDRLIHPSVADRTCGRSPRPG